MAKRGSSGWRDSGASELELAMEDLPQVKMSWDARRQLAMDIANLSPPDLAGVLQLVATNATTSLARIEYPPDATTRWDTLHTTPAALHIPPVQPQTIQMDCALDLDAADAELLYQLRDYVNECYIPHFVPKENCMICEGLWSTGRVVSCGNDECETKIHEECFGIVLREHEDGPWLCASCLVGRQLTCVVCMQTGGALKPLTSLTAAKDNIEDQRWVHVLCALTIPELTMRDVPSMEPVDGFEEIENGRFRYLCGICRKRGGASVICEQDNCNVGMHPLCAANAGFMIGNETKPLAVYCEKHLPSMRIAGAKRWICDEDLVEEIMSENSIDEDLEALLLDSSPRGDERYAFVLEATPSIYTRSKLLGTASVLEWGASTKVKTRQDLKARALEGVKVTPGTWSLPGMVVMGGNTHRPLVFPPRDHDRIGLPEFPTGEDLVGAVVEYLPTGQSEWTRSQVMEWDPKRAMHLVQIIAGDQKVWTKLSTANALVLYLAGEDSSVDAARVKLYRPLRKGVAEWRPKPRKFAAAEGV